MSKRVAFLPLTTNQSSASYRIRCLRVIEALCWQGLHADHLEKIHPVIPDVLVLSKRYDPGAIELACALRKSQQTRILLDVCDNHFVHDNVARSAQFKIAIELVDEVIASSEFLADQIREHSRPKSIRVIPDFIEPPILVSNDEFLRHSRFSLVRQLSAELDRAFPDRSNRLIWFGVAEGGNKESRMADLHIVLPVLERINQTAPVSLTVISNSQQRFREVLGSTSLKAFYLDWDLLTFSTALSSHGTAIIPITKNSFTLAKTANRLTTSLIHGLEVVCSEIPSYSRFADLVYFEDWESNLKQVLGGAKRDKSGWDPVAENLDVARLWLQAL